MILFDDFDSRALLCRNGGVVFETKDHNPSDEDEEKRVKEGGGKVHMTPGRHKVILDPGNCVCVCLCKKGIRR